jgi:hypothetical protein
MRGGLRDGNLLLILQRVVAWYVLWLHSNLPSLHLILNCRADLTSANILQSTPHFPEFELVNVPPPASWPFAHLDPLSTTRHPNPTLITTSLTNFDSNLQDIFTDLWKFPTSEKNPEMIDHIWYSDKIYLLQRSLMDIAYNKQHNTYHIDRACAIAALIYLHTGLCEVRIRSKVISVLVSRLKAELQMVMKGFGPGEDIGEMTRKLVWALYFGGVACGFEGQREWYLEQLGIACEALGLEAWPDMLAVLESMFWKDGCEQPTGALWRELEAKRRILDNRS